MVSNPGRGRIWRTLGGFGLLSVFLSSRALFAVNAVQAVTCPNGEVRTPVDARELAGRYEAASMADTLSGLSVLGARATADPAALQQAAIATWRWNQLLQGLADRYNRCLLPREQYAQALGKVYPRLREDAADLQQILKLLAQGKPVEEKRLGILIDSYSANLRRFAGLGGQDVLLDRIAAVVEREGGRDQEQILAGLASAEKSLKEAPPLAAPEAAEERIAKKLAKKGSNAAEDYRKGFELYQRYRFEESVPFFERALAAARVPELHAALGQALLQLSQLDRAETAFREGLALARREKDAEREAELALGLGQALLQKGDLPGALASARQSLAIQERAYGAEDVRTIHCHALIGQILNRQGDLAGALEATRRALRIAESSLGPDHPDTAVLLATLGGILLDRGDLDGALEYQRRALRLLEANSGPDNFEAVKVLGNIGRTLFDKGDLEGALQATQEVLSRNEKLFGPDHPRVAYGLRNLGMIHLRLGDSEAALQEIRRALQIYERILKPDDPDIAITASNLGQVLRERGDLDAALRSLERALRIDEEISGPDHPDVAMRANLIAATLREKGDLQGALAAVQRALRIDEKTYGPDHYNVARDSDTLAKILLDRGDLDGALKAARRALSIDELTYGADHKNVARDSDTLAAVLLARGDAEAALRAARRALAVGEKNFGPDHPVVAGYARQVGLVLREKGDLEGARSYLARSLRTFEAKYGPDHPMTRKAAEELRSYGGGTGWASRKTLPLAVPVLLAATALAGLFLYWRRRVPASAGDTTAAHAEATGSAPALTVVGPSGGLTRIGPYHLQERLGAGGMGVVYRAYDERLDRWVAVKIVPPGKSRDPQRRERLRREAQASARLSHPAIIQVHDFVQTDEVDGIVMELVDGEPLARLLSKGPLDLSRALPAARDVAEALAEAHSKGIIHRDLKAENVILTATGRAKVLDFGIAKRLDREDPSLTTEGAVIGTYRAMAPEQAQGQEMDHRADLFSLGTLFYEMFTGQSPFLGPTAADTLWRICCHGQSPARAVNPRVPEELSDLIDRLLQKEPQDRPQDAREVVAALSAIAASLAMAETAREPGQDSTFFEPLPRRSKRPAGF